MSTLALLSANYGVPAPGIVITTPAQQIARTLRVNEQFITDLLEAQRKRRDQISLGLPDATDKNLRALAISTQPRLMYGESSQNLYTDKRSKLQINKISSAGIPYPDPISDSNGLVVLSDILITGISENSRERVHLTQSTGGEKLYSFGREHRLFSVSAIVIDSKLSQPVGSWDGQGLRNWKNFYDNYAKLSACAKNGWLVVFNYHDRTIAGAITEYNLNSDCTTPNIHQLSFTFFVCSVA